MDDMKTQLVTFCKAEASAVVASAADFAVTLILAELLGLWYVCATFIGAVTGRTDAGTSSVQSYSSSAPHTPTA